MSVIRSKTVLAAVVLAQLAVMPARASSWSGTAGTTTRVEPDGTEASVRVDATEVTTMPRATIADVTTQATKVAVDAGVDPAAVTLTLVEVDPVEIIRGVRVSIAIDDSPLSDPDGDPRGPLLSQCTACSDVELGGLAVEAMLEAVERYRDAIEARRAAEQAAQAAAAAEPEPAEELPAEEPEPRKRVGPMGWAGVALLGVGVLSTVGGAVLATRSPEPFPGEQQKDTLRDLRPPGYALLGVGGVAMITGAVLLGIDQRRARHSSVALAPIRARGYWGMAVSGRF